MESTTITEPFHSIKDYPDTNNFDLDDLLKELDETIEAPKEITVLEEPPVMQYFVIITSIIILFVVLIIWYLRYLWNRG